MPNPAEQAGLQAMHQQAQMRATVDARARMQARKKADTAEGGMPATRQSSASSTSARVWLIIACLLILGAMLYAVIIR